jgi:predicted Zn-dependent peptidase
VTTVRLDDGLFQTSAPNGCTLLTEALPGVRSAALGIWVRSASAHEARPKMGVSHLLEHMVFKGTERRSARQIALELEVRGGSLDAYTSRDHTSFQAHVLDTDLPLAADILTDLVRRPLLREQDLVPERNVVLEEINGVADTPDDLVFELHSETLWPAHPYGYSILGSAETVGALSTDDLQASHRRGYFRGNCVIAAAGNVDHERLLAVLAGEGWFDGPEPEAPLPPAAVGVPERGVVRRERRDTTQAHIVIGTDTFPYADSRRYAMAMLVNAFGGGMSSRLFQRIREELGLAYAIYAYHQFYRSAGQSGVYVGTQPGTAAQATDAILDEYRRLAEEGLSAVEAEDARRQLKGQLMLGLESPQSRMNRLASLALQGEPYRPLDRVLEEIDAVSPDTLAAVAAEYFEPERQTIVRLGPED